MIKEIKRLRYFDEFKKKICADFYLSDNSLFVYYQCFHKKSERRLFVKDERTFTIHLRNIIELIPTKLERDEIIDFINSEFNKDNLPYYVN